MEIEDRYKHLEKVDSSSVKTWIKRNNDRYDKYLSSLNEESPIKELVEKFSDFDKFLPLIQRGEDIYCLTQEKEGFCLFKNDGDIVQVMEGRAFDFKVNKKGDIAAICMSDFDNPMEKYWVFIDTKTKEHLWSLEDTIFSFYDFAKGVFWVSWNEEKQNTALHYIDLETGDKRRFLSFNQPGTKIYEVKSSKDGKILFILTNFHSNVFDLISNENLITMAFSRYIGEINNKFFFLKMESDWESAKIISIDNPLITQDLNETVVLENVPEGIYSMKTLDNKLVLSCIEHCTSHVEFFDENGNKLFYLSSPGRGVFSISSELLVDEEDVGVCYTYQDFFHPPTLYILDMNTFVSEIRPQTFDWDVCQYDINQVFFTSKDGTRVPMFICNKKGLKIDENTKTLLYGYGGFGANEIPAFDPLINAWLEMGNIYVLANIRGGGEFGTKWHKEGCLQNKQNSFDDFICAAEQLISLGYTTSSRLGIHGVSNGGLLVGACLTQRPDLFGACVADFGVYDMLTPNPIIRREYGDRDNIDDFNVMYSYSPYHQVKEGISYPPILIRAAEKDGNADPFHSYKFAEALINTNLDNYLIFCRTYLDREHCTLIKEQKIKEDIEMLSFLNNELH